MAETDPTVLACPKCKAPLPLSVFNTPGQVPCPSCYVALKAAAFPALFRPIARGKQGDSLLLDDEASCFYHPEKKAAVACEACGRFLCDLCHINMNSQDLCPGCIETSRKKGKLSAVRKRVMLHDDVALALAVWPPLLVFTSPFTCVTAPAAIVVAILGWRKPSSILPRTKVRFVIAIILAVLQLAGWIAILVALALKDVAL